MSDHSHVPVAVSEASKSAGHEVADADASVLVKVGIGIAVLMLVAFVAMVVLFRTLVYVQPLYNADTDPHPLSGTQSAYEGPRLQPDPPRQKLELEQRDEQFLTTYDWVDKESGVARIPVSRAIELLATTGLPEKSGSGADPAPAPNN